MRCLGCNQIFTVTGYAAHVRYTSKKVCRNAYQNDLLQALTEEQHHETVEQDLSGEETAGVVNDKDFDWLEGEGMLYFSNF